MLNFSIKFFLNLTNLEDVSGFWPERVHGFIDGSEEEGNENEESKKRAKNSEDKLKRSATNDATIDERFCALIQIMS